MTVKEQLLKILRSRKFWVLLAAIITAAGAFFSGQVDAWQALQAIVAALAVYSTGIALEDSALRKAGG